MQATKTTTLTNVYHGTSCTVRRSPVDIEAVCDRLWSGTATYADREFARRCKAALCGSLDCTCGDVLGRRE